MKSRRARRPPWKPGPVKSAGDHAVTKLTACEFVPALTPSAAQFGKRSVRKGLPPRGSRANTPGLPHRRPFSLQSASPRRPRCNSGAALTPPAPRAPSRVQIPQHAAASPLDGRGAAVNGNASSPSQRIVSRASMPLRGKLGLEQGKPGAPAGSGASPLTPAWWHAPTNGACNTPQRSVSERH